MAKRRVPDGMKRVQATITMLVSDRFEDYDTNNRLTTHASLAREIRSALPCTTPFGSIEGVSSVSIVELDEPNYSATSPKKKVTVAEKVNTMYRRRGERE